jgi:CheY-like chemotaxis protein
MSEVPLLLVVDDSEVILDVVSAVLRHSGFRVIAASAGDAALERTGFGEEPLQLAILDIHLPGMSGPELFRQLRGLYRQVPALFMSGYETSPGDVPAGCGFLAKPFTAGQLLRHVRRQLDRPIAFGV